MAVSDQEASGQARSRWLAGREALTTEEKIEEDTNLSRWTAQGATVEPSTDRNLLGLGLEKEIEYGPRWSIKATSTGTEAITLTSGSLTDPDTFQALNMVVVPEGDKVTEGIQVGVEGHIYTDTRGRVGTLALECFDEAGASLGVEMMDTWVLHKRRPRRHDDRNGWARLQGVSDPVPAGAAMIAVKITYSTPRVGEVCYFDGLCVINATRSWPL